MADDIKVAEPKQKIQVDLEVDTSVKDLGVNPYAKLIHMARAVDASHRLQTSYTQANKK